MVNLIVLCCMNIPVCVECCGLTKSLQRDNGCSLFCFGVFPGSGTSLWMVTILGVGTVPEYRDIFLMD